MIQEEIEKLQARLNKLKGEKQQTPLHGGQLGQQFEEMGKSFQEIGKRIPHVKIGRDNQNPIDEDPFIKKFKKWALIILTIVIAGTAGILIVWRVLSRFI